MSKKPKKNKGSKTASRIIKTKLTIATTPKKRHYVRKTRKTDGKKPSATLGIVPKKKTKNSCCFLSCNKKWSDRNDDARWIECCICNSWTCDDCAKIKRISKETIDKTKFYCKTCRKK